MRRLLDLRLPDEIPSGLQMIGSTESWNYWRKSKSSLCIHFTFTFREKKKLKKACFSIINENGTVP
jgi:hypothetical protein